MKTANKLIAVADCRRQAFLYEQQAKAESFAGMRTALLSVSRDWLAIADKIDRLAIVREINSVPAAATPNAKQASAPLIKRTEHHALTGRAHERTRRLADAV